MSRISKCHSFTVSDNQRKVEKSTYQDQHRNLSMFAMGYSNKVFCFGGVNYRGVQYLYVGFDFKSSSDPNGFKKYILYKKLNTNIQTLIWIELKYYYSELLQLEICPWNHAGERSDFSPHIVIGFFLWLHEEPHIFARDIRLVVYKSQTYSNQF